MCVRNSLDLVEQIVSIVVSFPNNVEEEFYLQSMMRQIQDI